MATLITVNASSAWNVATDFSPEGVPTTGDIVQLGSGHTLSIPTGVTTDYVQRIEDAANGTLVVEAGATLRMQGGIVFNGGGSLIILRGNCVVESDSSDQAGSASAVIASNSQVRTENTSTSARATIKNTGATFAKSVSGYGPYYLEWVEMTGNSYINVYGTDIRACEFRNCRFFDMQSDWYGYCRDGDFLKFVNCLFEGCTGPYFFRACNRLELENCAFNYNEAGTVDGSAAKIARGTVNGRNVKISGGDYANYTIEWEDLQLLKGCGYINPVGLLANISGAAVGQSNFYSRYGTITLVDDSGTSALAITPSSLVNTEKVPFTTERLWAKALPRLSVPGGSAVSLTVNARKTAGQPAGSFKVYLDYGNGNGTEDATDAIDSATYADYTASATAPAGSSVHEVSVMPVITDYASGGVCYIASMVAVVGSITYTLDLASMAWVATGAGGGEPVAIENHFRSSHFGGTH